MLTPAEVASIYDRHARSTYGLALLVSRHRRDARKALLLAFRDYAKGPAPESDRARFDLLHLALGWAQQFRKTHLHLWRHRHSAAVTAAFGPELDALPTSEAVRRALVELEGVAPEELSTGTAPAPSTAEGWAAPPRSMRALTIMVASEAADPSRRMRRWAWMWGAVAASVLLVAGTQWLAPDLPSPRTQRAR